MPTRVVNVRSFGPQNQAAPDFIYVGRFMPGRFKGSPLGNPYKVKRGATNAELRECMAQYRQWLDRPEQQTALRELAEQVRTTGLPIACWCKPNPCHGDELAARVDAILGRSGHAD